MESAPLTLAQIPTIRLDSWKTINPDALFFLHVVLVAAAEWTGPSPPTWEKEKDTITNEVEQKKKKKKTKKKKEVVLFQFCNCLYD
jgi:hypothetical protein